MHLQCRIVVTTTSREHPASSPTVLPSCVEKPQVEHSERATGTDHTKRLQPRATIHSTSRSCRNASVPNTGFTTLNASGTPDYVQPRYEQVLTQQHLCLWFRRVERFAWQHHARPQHLSLIASATDDTTRAHRVRSESVDTCESDS